MPGKAENLYQRVGIHLNTNIMKTKFLLPVLAIIFATAMSFTTVEMNKTQGQDYIRSNNQWMPIPEVDCGNGGLKCQVRLPDGSVHEVYDTQNLSSIKDTGNPNPFEL